MARAEGWASQVHTEGYAIGEKTACAQQLATRWRSGRGQPVLPLLQHLQHQGSSMQASKQNIKLHEASQLHQRAALKWQEIQDKRGVLQGYQDAAAQLTAQRRAGQTASLKTSTVFASVLKHMRLGRPITDVLADKDFLQFVEPAPSVGVTELNRHS